MKSSGQGPGKREITYRVGWKKGTIAASGKRPGPNEPEDTAVSAVERWMRRSAWQPAPFVPDKVVPIALWALPGVAFALTLWLAYKLARG